MADSNAERQRRYKAHRRGQHHLCRPESCPEAEDAAGVREHLAFAATVTLPAGADGRDLEPWQKGVTGAVHRLLEVVSFEEGDPRVVLAACALRLAESLDSHGPSPAQVTQELQRVLGHIIEAPEEPPDEVDRLRAVHASRRVPNLIEWAQGQAGMGDAG